MTTIIAFVAGFVCFPLFHYLFKKYEVVVLKYMFPSLNPPTTTAPTPTA
jgi:hypothetical protein